jgi:hypothetical protein
MEGFISKQGSWWWPADTFWFLFEAGWSHWSEYHLLQSCLVVHFSHTSTHSPYLGWQSQKNAKLSGWWLIHPENDRHIRFVSFSNEQLSVWNWGIRLAGKVIFKTDFKGFSPTFSKKSKELTSFLSPTGHC